VNANRVLLWAAYAVIGYTVIASVYNRGYIAGSIDTPLPNPLGNWFGLR
jgi:hypothetical protein